MLPEDHRQEYQEFSLLLGELQNLAGQENLDRLALFHRSKELQDYFGDRIIALDNSFLDPAWGSLVQSYITEIHKQLRLLGMDITFLQASRSDRTTNTRKEAISDRLQTIIGYCSTLTAKNESTTAEESHKDEKP